MMRWSNYNEKSRRETYNECHSMDSHVIDSGVSLSERFVYESLKHDNRGKEYMKGPTLSEEIKEYMKDPDALLFAPIIIPFTILCRLKDNITDMLSGVAYRLKSKEEKEKYSLKTFSEYMGKLFDMAEYIEAKARNEYEKIELLNEEFAKFKPQRPDEYGLELTNMLDTGKSNTSAASKLHLAMGEILGIPNIHLVEIPKHLCGIASKGNALYGLKRYEEALECYDEFLKNNPNNVGVLTHKGETLSKLGRDEEAQQCEDKIKNIKNFMDVRIDVTQENRESKDFSGRENTYEKYIKPIADELQEEGYRIKTKGKAKRWNCKIEISNPESSVTIRLDTIAHVLAEDSGGCFAPDIHYRRDIFGEEPLPCNYELYDLGDGYIGGKDFGKSGIQRVAIGEGINITSEPQSIELSKKITRKIFERMMQDGTNVEKRCKLESFK